MYPGVYVCVWVGGCEGVGVCVFVYVRGGGGGGASLVGWGGGEWGGVSVERKT